MNRIVDQFLVDTYSRYDSMARAFGQLRHGAPQQGAKNVLAVAEQVAHLIRRSLELELAANPNFTESDVIGTTRLRSGLMSELHDFIFGMISAAPPHAFPDELTPFLHSKISAYTSSYDLILLPSDRDTIEILTVSQLYDNYVRHLNPYVPTDLRTCNKASDWVIVLLFPITDARTFNVHPAILGHELNHLRDRIEGISADLINTGQVSVPASRLRPLVSPDRNAAQVATLANNTLAGWLSELVGDLIAIHEYGPAAFLAFARIAYAAGPVEDSSDTHPDPLLRLNLMLDELSHLGYFAPRLLPSNRDKLATIEIRRTLRTWRRYLRRSYNAANDIHNAVRSGVTRSRSVTNIQAAVRTAVSGAGYTFVRYANEVPTLTDTLVSGIPPSEIVDREQNLVRPASIPGIFNATFEVWQHHRPEFSKQLQPAADRHGHELEVLSRLELKAIEARSFYEAAGTPGI